MKAKAILAAALMCASPLALSPALAAPKGEPSAKSEREVALCDTTGRLAPDHVQTLFHACQLNFPRVGPWAFHAHDTYGIGLANAYAAYMQGVRIFDASVAGLGGCPFAPGAAGNVATEDLVWMFERMGIYTAISIGELIEAAREAALLPGAVTGGRVRSSPLALSYSQRKDSTSNVQDKDCFVLNREPKFRRN